MKICVRILSLFLATGLFISVHAADRIPQPVDTGRMVKLRGHLRAEVATSADLGDVDPAREIGYVTLLMKPAPGLEDFLAEQRNPSSAHYRRWLTPEEFGDRFGLNNNDMDKVVAWLKSQGLRVHDVAPP